MRKFGSRLPYTYARWEGIVQDDCHVLKSCTMAVSREAAERNLLQQFYRQYHYRPLGESVRVWEKKPALAAK